jgi:hypothetical protein
MSATSRLVPWVMLANHGPPKNPHHNPSSVETMYHSGGSRRAAMAARPSWSPAIDPVTTAKIVAMISPARNPPAPARSQTHALLRVVGAAPARS